MHLKLTCCQSTYDDSYISVIDIFRGNKVKRLLLTEKQQPVDGLSPQLSELNRCV